jgi:hypothetical protein
MIAKLKNVGLVRKMLSGNLTLWSCITRRSEQYLRRAANMH